MQSAKPSLGAGPRGWVRAARVAAIIAVAVAICAYLDHETRTFDLLEQKTYGERLEVAARVDAGFLQRAQRRVVLVALSDATFAPRSGLAPQPFLARADHAAIIRQLTRCGAKVIAFDLLFDTAQPGDDAFAASVLSSKRVLLACGDDSADPPHLLLPEACLLRAGAHRGHTRCPIDIDRPALDRIRPVISEQGRPVPAFCAEAVRMALGGCDRPWTRTPAGWRCGALDIPVNADDTFRLRYFPPERAKFTTIPYEDVLSGAARSAFYRGIFQDKIVLIGDTTRIHGDVHLTPLGMMSGVEIQAHAIATLLAGRFLRDAPWRANLAAMIVLAFLTVPAALLGRMRQAALFLALLPPAYLLFNVWLFVEGNTVLHLVAPATALLAASFGVLLERGLTEEHEKTQVRTLLLRYVNPKIAAHLLKHPELMGRAGTRATGTMLFCDIRGFTAYSKRLPPEELVSRTNDYFEIMTSIIFRHDGTVANIAGDLLFAVFGVPVETKDHALRAVAAAIEMGGALERIRERWDDPGSEPFEIGVGINTGEMIVGDIGSAQLRNFTVYGLEVNIAARVEGLNKDLKTRILITCSTYALIQDKIRVRGPIQCSLKGIEVAVYEVLGWREQA